MGKKEMDVDDTDDSESASQPINKSILRLFEDYFVLPTASQLKSLCTFSDSGIHRVNMQLALNRKLIEHHDAMIFHLADDLGHKQSKSRTKALKSVMGKFKDRSAAVREAAVDLVGHYVVDSAALIEEYFDDLRPRIYDTSVAVRKRVIKIFGDICLRAPHNKK